MGDERDQARAAAYRLLGRHDDLIRVLGRRFNAARSRRSLEELIEVMGAEHRNEVLEEAAAAIQGAPAFDTGDASFLLDCGDPADAESYVIQRQSQIDGTRWYNLLPLARAFDKAERRVAATVIYRALLESILARAQARNYGQGARHWHTLERLATGVVDWRGLTPHAAYTEATLERHLRKAAFWKRVADAASGKV